MAEDPKISKRYRELPREEPPRKLDDAILAASRRAVYGRRRWYVPVAAAAVIVLAVAVVVQIDRQQPETEVVTPQSRVLETPPPAPAQPRRDEAPRAGEKPARAPAAASAAPEAPASVEERKAMDALGAREADNRTARGRIEGAPPPQAPQAAASASRLAKVAPSPEQWLQGIADLRRQGRHEEADRELAEFRKRYPDYRLSEEMRAKVEKR